MGRPLIGITTDLDDADGRDRVFAWLSYVDAVLGVGGLPLLIPPQPLNGAQIIATVDGIILPGGYDCDPALYGEAPHPKTTRMDVRRQESELSLASLAREAGVPLLGICLGCQVMNIAAGGSLVQDIESHFETPLEHRRQGEERTRHDVHIEPGTKLSAILDVEQLNVNSSHHQSIRLPGEGLRITAHAPDGVVEGIEDPHHGFYVGVQWHPEDIAREPASRRLFAAFVDAAGARAAARASGGSATRS